MEMILGGIAISGVIGGLLGHALKDRPNAGVLLGLLLGPIGWLAVFALKDNLRKCPSCLGRVENDATTCRHCRADLPPAPEKAKIGVVPMSLRIVGVVGFVFTALMVILRTQDDKATDGDILMVGLVGAGISVVVFVAGLVLSRSPQAGQ